MNDEVNAQMNLRDLESHRATGRSTIESPIDDGGADHLPGMSVPSIALQATNGQWVDLSTREGLTVVYAYPRTSAPGTPSPDGWDTLPGAKGCTPQSCAFRDHHQELKALGVAGLFGLSTQGTDYQREAAERLHLPFPLLSDDRLAFAEAMRLPTFEVDGMVLLKRLTLVIEDARVRHVFYPVFPPERNASDVIAWLSRHGAPGTKSGA